MIRIKLLCVFAFLAFIVGVLFINNPATTFVGAYSNGANPGFTGAPGELTCTECHIQHTGVGQFSINAPTNYAPGQTYQIQVQHATTDQTRMRWGFQLTALAGLNAAGTFAESSPFVAIESGETRDYVNHTDEGTFAGQQNGALWTFQWTAPAVSQGPVIFYAAGNQADNNNVFTGDQIYTAIAFSNPAGTPTPSPTSTPALTGRITYKNTLTPNYAIPNVTLNAAGAIPLMTLTDSNGNYTLAGFGGGSYTVTPSLPRMSSSNANGIFSNDAAMVSRHVVGLAALTATQQEAARVGGNTMITSQDASLIARWIVGIDDTVNQTGKWTYTPVNRFYPGVTGIQPGQDYAGTLMGDVSGDWSNGVDGLGRMFEGSKKGPVIVSIGDVVTRAGEEVEVPLKIENLSGRAVSSYQFDLLYDASIITTADAVLDLLGTMSQGMSIAANPSEPGRIRVVVYGPVPVSGDGVYAVIRFAAKGRKGSSSSLTLKGFRLNDGTDEMIICDGKLNIRNEAWTRW